MSTHIKMVVFLSLGLLAAFAWHFATVFGFFCTAPQTQTEFFMRIGLFVVAFIVVSAVSSIMLAKQDENAELPDEREETVELKADRVGVITLYLGLFVLMWFVFMPMTSMQVANAILGVVCISELIKIVYGLLLLKRGV